MFRFALAIAITLATFAAAANAGGQAVIEWDPSKPLPGWRPTLTAGPGLLIVPADRRPACERLWEAVRDIIGIDDTETLIGCHGGACGPLSQAAQAVGSRIRNRPLIRRAAQFTFRPLARLLGR